MSKYVKYISNTHHGAPQLKGDRWGYCVELLRTCLVTGFNERTDLVKFEVLTPESVKFTFTSDHMYVEHQTIKISGLSFPELNTDFFILSSTAKEVTVKSYVDLSGLVGQVQSVVAKSIVAPLGFIEKFKDGNRSAFTTDEEEAFFCIDDTQPDNWPATSTSVCIKPIVYMTDKKTDINTDGKFIFPFNTTNPTWYKLRGFYDGTITNFRNGIMNFTTYPNTSVVNKTVPLEYSIIGNGRMFHLLINVNNTSFSSDYYNIYSFGKIENINSKKTTLPYILHGNIYAPISNNNGVYHSGSALSGYKTFTQYGALSVNDFMIVKNSLRFPAGILNTLGDTSVVLYRPTKGSVSSGSLISGASEGDVSYPDIYGRKFYISRININTTKGNVGLLPGLMWNYNASSLLKNSIIIQYKYKNKSKFMFNINSAYNYTTATTGTPYSTQYTISLDYADWRNYE